VSKKVCVADPRLSSGELRGLAEQQAPIQAVRDFAKPASGKAMTILYSACFTRPPWKMPAS
jgi:hypothetical protein